MKYYTNTVLVRVHSEYIPVYYIYEYVRLNSNLGQIKISPHQSFYVAVCKFIIIIVKAPYVPAP